MNKTNVHEREILDILHRIDDEKLKELFDRARELKEAEKKEPIDGVLYAAACGIKNSEKEQPVCEELEEEMDKFFETMPVLEHENIFEDTFKNIARHFAKWGAEHFHPADGKKWIYEDEYKKDLERLFNDGKQVMRELMLKEAVDGVIYGDVRSQEDQPYQIYAESDYLPMDKFKQYDKVKLIVIKED